MSNAPFVLTKKGKARGCTPLVARMQVRSLPDFLTEKQSRSLDRDEQ